MAVQIPDELKQAKKALEAGQKPKATVREFLNWFGAARRRQGVVERVRSALDKLGLLTYPDFEGEYIDAPVFFMDKSSFKPLTKITATGATNKEISQPAQVDPTHRLGRLQAANRPPVSVKPGSTLQTATTLMLAHDYSQLPVMPNERSVKGMVSWKSIGSRLALNRTCAKVDDCMDPHRELTDDASLFDAINIISKHDCVLVRDRDNKITGVVTAADINEQFRTLAEPFLLLGDIENRIRSLITPRFSKHELAAVRDPADAGRSVEDVTDLSFGEYQRLLEKEERWNKLGLPIDRVTFIKDLDKVRVIRNEVMHFDPDGITEDSLEDLRRFSKFLMRLQSLTA